MVTMSLIHNDCIACEKLLNSKTVIMVISVIVIISHSRDVGGPSRSIFHVWDVELKSLSRGKRVGTSLGAMWAPKKIKKAFVQSTLLVTFLALLRWGRAFVFFLFWGDMVLEGSIVIV